MKVKINNKHERICMPVISSGTTQYGLWLVNLNLNITRELPRKLATTRLAGVFMFQWSSAPEEAFACWFDPHAHVALAFLV